MNIPHTDKFSRRKPSTAHQFNFCTCKIFGDEKVANLSTTQGKEQPGESLVGQPCSKHALARLCKRVTGKANLEGLYPALTIYGSGKDHRRWCI